MASVLVTGATGFIGRALCLRLVQMGVPVRAVVRKQPDPGANAVGALETTAVGDIGELAQTDWMPLLNGISVVVHLAARAHVLRESAHDPMAEYRRVNVKGAVGLARAAARAGVRRFVYVSSIGVHGTMTAAKPFSEDDRLQPEDPYALSKLEAENALRTVATKTGLELVILRPPLVYGPGVAGNFSRLLEWVDSGWPLPFGAVHNRRSLISLDNLVSLLMICVDHPAAAGEIFVAADGEDLSTAGLVERLAMALGKRPRLVSVPPRLLSVGARILGQSRAYVSLCASLAVDAQKARRVLDWSPVVSVDEGLQRAARWYLESRQRR